MTISQLSSKIEKVVKTGFPAPVLVKGELSNFRPHAASGHWYFTLKDAQTCIDCAMWKSDAGRVKFDPQDGMELLARGTVGVYGQRGKYQLYVSSLQPLGQGALELAFKQTCAKLEAEGLFNPDRKRSLPKYPTRVVLITSSDAAALADMLKVLKRFPWISLYIYHVPVQGNGCGRKIAEALNHLSREIESFGGADVVILSRGGGSLEDLWGFNEEAVARAIAKCRAPVVTGIGHEVDVSIADLVADYHAHTPTEAAQVVTAHWRGASETLNASAGRLVRAAGNALQDARHRLLTCERHEMFRRPLQRVIAMRQFLDDRQRTLAATAKARMARVRRRIDALNARLAVHHPRNVLALAKQRVQSLSRHLQAVSPDQVLKRGYSITTRQRDGAIVRDATQLKAGERIVTRLTDGEVESIVDDRQQPDLFS